MRPIIELLSGSAPRARLHDAVLMLRRTGPTLELVPASNPSDLARRAAAAPGALVVVDPFVRGTSSPSWFPRLCSGPARVVAYADFDFHPPREVLHLARAGVDEVVSFGEDDEPEEFARLLSDVMKRAGVGRIMSALQDILPSDGLMVIEKLLPAATSPLTPAGAARLCTCHPSTLLIELRRAGLPPINKLLVWLRLMHVAERLEGAHGSVERVAFGLGFPSDSALRNQCRRYAALRPAELRRSGGLQRVLAAFEERVESGCWALEGPRRFQDRE